MTHLRSRRRRLLAPLGLALAVSAATLGAVPGAATAAPQKAAAEGDTLSYVVNTRTGHHTVEAVKKAIETSEGSSVVAAYERIGVIVAHSTDPRFAERIRGVRGVQTAGASRTAPFEAAGTTEVGAPEYVEAPKASARSAKGDAEPLEADQWDLRAIGADKAAKINPGSSKVTVGVIDTGVDDTHPDLAPNFSASQSASCVGGKADTSPGAWRPHNAEHYHGTHVAGEIAAARNGVGVAGVAPGVQVASIKVADPQTELFTPESVVCAFVFAGDKGIDVTNNSYYVDPWMYNCLDDPDQKAIVDAVNRAQRYAHRKGTLHVASAGNSNHDLASDEILDDSSPNDSTPVERTIDPSECLDIPTQLPGVVTVSATGPTEAKSYYSTYGKGIVDVAGPGGDGNVPADTPSKNGRILSTMPDGEYGYLQGTSMAAPHVAAVAALIKSTHPKAGPTALQALLKLQADNPGCPSEPYDPDGDGTVDAVCEGAERVNGFYGFGIVDALDAVRR
ncbi:Subtilisin BL [Streptomyces sp. YIM 130001]|uniref:S8 family peptidase n=1 Tax=Streptomyces sp. YIM 130001 TaxID=2259644 RepID=UPI000E65C8B0|nr:S8 family serine peptidase [Streptomyces sp. YIM 130001]RII18574.1 Subtilisin BL [Streptomyces sp. YIM 130001]